MDRRHFLSTTMLSSLGALAMAGTARAFSTQDCDSESDPACRELLRHRELLANIDAALARKGLDADQRKAVLARSVCPFCGLPLSG